MARAKVTKIPNCYEVLAVISKNADGRYGPILHEMMQSIDLSFLDSRYKGTPPSGFYAVAYGGEGVHLPKRRPREKFIVRYTEMKEKEF